MAIKTPPQPTLWRTPLMGGRGLRERLRLRPQIQGVNPVLLLALALALAYHGVLSFYTHGRTYDAFVHIFFADHYARTWFDHWDYRWYTGFTLTSYPPGSQQAIALLASLVGLRNGFVIVQTFAILMLTVGMYRYARIWVDEEAAGYAALLTVFASSITETIHVFGQLPTTFSLGFLLNALPYVYRWLREGRMRLLLLAWAANAATTAGHHVTTLFGAVFFVAPVIVRALLDDLRRELPDEPIQRPVRVTWRTLRPLLVRRLRRILPTTIRAGVYGVGLIALLVLVVLPYWLWSRSDPITQVSIPHASRDSFLVNLNAGLVFWLIPYGLSLVALPYVLYKGLTTRAWPATLSLGALIFLGTGGTTPFPRMLLRGAFDVLTLDRFTFWATIVMLPLLGAFVVSLRRGGLARYISEQFGRGMLRAAQVALVVGYLLVSIFTANLTQFRRFQPPAIDMAPIVTFLEKDGHWRWRYLTLGFGDQVAWLGALTTATSVDGNYHSARRLPELTSTPVERLEGAKFRGIPGIGSLQQFLAVPEKYNLKFVFSVDEFYDPLLYFSGWHRLQRLENGVVVWERADIPALPEVLPRREIPIYQRVMWGLVPMSAIFTALALMGYALFRQLITGQPAAAERTWGITRLLRLLARRRPTDDDVAAFPLSRSRKRGAGGEGHQTPSLWRRLDDLLRRWSALPEGADDGPAVPWQFWIAWAQGRPWPRPAAPTAKVVRSTLLIVALLIALASGAAAYLGQARSPAQVVSAYYDDLDFRRFTEAYARIDPQSRPDFERYLLGLSLRGGLLASYGKLDSVRVRVLGGDDRRLTVEVATEWVTALNSYPAWRQHELVRRDGRWYILPDPIEIQNPSDLFLRRPVLQYLAPEASPLSRDLGLPPASSDRPELEILSARLVREGLRYSVVGELANRDADPTDLTVSAVLYGAGDVELSRYNAQRAMIHKLLPGEVTPFRVDFEGVAGASITDTMKLGDFAPNDFTPIDLDQPVVSFAALARGIVTGRDLGRDLSPQELRLSAAPDGTLTLSGALFNSGTREATIPQLLITCYDAEGRVLWVEDHVLESGVLPQERRPFTLRIPPAYGRETLLDQGGLFPAPSDNALRTTAAERIPAPPGTGYASIRVSVRTFGNQ